MHYFKVEWLLYTEVYLSDNRSELFEIINWGTIFNIWRLFEPASATSNRRWRLVSAQLWNKFGYCPSSIVSIVLAFHKNNRLSLGRYESSSPATKVLSMHNHFHIFQANSRGENQGTVSFKTLESKLNLPTTKKPRA